MPGPVGEQTTTTGHELLVHFENILSDDAGAVAFATSTADPSGVVGGEYGASYLLTEDLDTAWRSGTLDDDDQETIEIDFTLEEAADVDWFSMHRHNVRVPFRVTLFDGVTSLVQSAWIDPVVKVGEGDTLGTFDVASGPTERRVEILASLFRLESVVDFGQTYSGVDRVNVTFDVTAQINGDKDYLQAAHMRAGVAFRPSVNMSLGWGVGVVDRSTFRRTEGGSKRGRRKTTARNFTFTLGALERDEAFRQVLTGWLREQGAAGLAFFWPEPEERQSFYDQALLGQLEALPKITMARLELPEGQGFSVEEAR